MPKLADNAVPSYRLHRQFGQAIVTLSGQDVLLGTHGSVASRKEYGRLIAEWLANARSRFRHCRWHGGRASAGGGLTVNELILAYWRFAKGYYKNGRHTSEIPALNQALEPLKELYGKTLAREFRPLALQAVRAKMIDRKWSRKTPSTSTSSGSSGCLSGPWPASWCLRTSTTGSVPSTACGGGGARRRKAPRLA